MIARRGELDQLQGMGRHAHDAADPAGLMAAATVNLPAIVLSGGPMLDSYLDGKLCGSGVVIWEARRRMAALGLNECLSYSFIDASAAELFGGGGDGAVVE